MKKLLSILTVSAVTVAALTGCATNKLTKQANVNYIGVDAAKNAALSNANIDVSNAVFTEAKLDDKYGTAYYEVDFTANGVEYEYDIDAITGTVIEQNQQTLDNNTTYKVQEEVVDYNTSIGYYIDEAKAKEIALNHAGVTEADTSFIWAKSDNDDGRQVFDVEFYVSSTNSEYDYEIDAQTGEIISFDYDAENYTPSTNNTNTNSTTTKTEQEIKDIALAKVPNATEKDIQVKLDRDDGKLKYEGKIIYEGMEYDFEIDAYSGAILEWEAESVFD